MREYEIRWNEELVATVIDEPGPLISALAPPPRRGERLPTSEFLSATAYSPVHEGRLRDILDSCVSFEEFLGALRSEGYAIARRGSEAE